MAPLVCIGGSAGAIEALRILLRALPADLPAAVAVVVHTSPAREHRLADVFRRAGNLPASVADDGVEPRPGHVYVAPADRHLVVRGGRLALEHGPTVNRVRPAIDPLFETAAAELDGSTIGVVLSGMLDDGTAGLLEIARRGGRTFVQDPRDALHPEMPTNAARFGTPDAVLHAAGLADAIIEAVQVAAGPRGGGPAQPARPDDEEGRVSGLTCPSCAGAVWERHVGGLTTCRCRVGHVLSQANMRREQDEMVEQALWAGVRALEERAALATVLAERLPADDADVAAIRRRADEAMRDAAVMRTLLERG